MLKKETKDLLAAKGIDVDALIEAIKTEDEVDVKIPTLYTEEEKKAYGDNRAKQEQTIVREIVAKDIAKKYGVEVTTKDPLAIVEEVAKKKIEEAKIPTSDQLKKAQETIKTLQDKYQTVERQLNETKQEYETRLFQTQLRQKALSVLPSNTTLPKEDLIDLFFMRAKVNKDDEGNLIVELNGKPAKDNLENPLPFEQVVKSFAEQYIAKPTPPAGGGTGGGGGALPKEFTKLSEVAKWAHDNDIVINSPEFNKILSEKKAANFEFDEIPEEYL